VIDKLSQFIQKKKLFLPHEKILLAVSGGMDSVVMAHLFKAAGFDFAIAHCNFKLRGKDADQDEDFYRETGFATESRILFRII
jgi:tRNA(Ile)-lysidine synthase